MTTKRTDLIERMAEAMWTECRRDIYAFNRYLPKKPVWSEVSEKIRTQVIGVARAALRVVEREKR